MHARMHGTTNRCGIPALAESMTKKRAVHRSKTMKCDHPASTEVASENIRPIPAVVLNEAMSRENIAFEKRTYARVTYNSEYATAVKSVIVFVCLHRGRNTRENHAGNDPRFTAWRIWLCVYGRKGIGPAATTAPPFAFAAASDAPVRGCEMARVRTRIERRERSRAAAAAAF